MRIPPNADYQRSWLALEDPELAAVRMFMQFVKDGMLRHRPLLRDVFRVIEDLDSRGSDKAADDIDKAIKVEDKRVREQSEAKGEQPPVPPMEAFHPSLFEQHSPKAPIANGEYKESITADHTLATRIKSLMLQSKLSFEDVEFLEKFVDDQSVGPPRFLLKSLWSLKTKSDHCLRAVGPWGLRGGHNTYNPVSWLSFPVRQLWDMVYSLDSADAAARAWNGDDTSKDGVREAPKGKLAVLLRAGPRPAAVWSILTLLLYLVVSVLLFGNLHMYISMHREQGMWAGVNDGPPMWRGGCWRVCSSAGSGAGWRWKGMVREWLSEGFW